jgi:plastocyanin
MTTPPPDVTGTTVTVSETEFAIDLSQDTFAPGTYTFEVVNDGGISHNLNISGPGLAREMTSTVSPGGSESLTVTLEEGTYELWCSIGSHKAQGMDLTITVG